MRGSKSSHEADALLKISQAAVGTTILASCRADELSYEDESWQNGAFTKSLLEAFSNQSCSDEAGGFSSDANKDGLVTLGEIVGFIKRRVPVLAAGQKRLTSQNPVLINGELDSEIPLILLNRWGYLKNISTIFYVKSTIIRGICVFLLHSAVYLSKTY